MAAAVAAKPALYVLNHWAKFVSDPAMWTPESRLSAVWHYLARDSLAKSG
jgi:hypothetical protein